MCMTMAMNRMMIQKAMAPMVYLSKATMAEIDPEPTSGFRKQLGMVGSFITT